MSEQLVSINIKVEWRRPTGEDGPWRWGAKKDSRIDPTWSKRDVIYRWVKNSTHEVAMVGETERMIAKRVDNYPHARANGGAGATNKRLWQEQKQLELSGDYLYLEVTDTVPGYDLHDRRQRRQAEALLCGATRPYLQ